MTLEYSNNKTSLLISDQVPRFVRDEHDTFIKFLEYYYKFLEQDGQTLYVSKNFMQFMDIDKIYEDIAGDLEHGDNHSGREETDYHLFLQKMYDQYISLIPDNSLANRNLLVKHAKEFYRATGSEKSLKFLIRALFNKESTIYYPKRDILRASDGKWFIEKSLKITDVAVENVINAAAATRFTSRRIQGLVSNAKAVVESVDSYFDKGELVTELKLSNIDNDFVSGETIFTYFTDEGKDYRLTANMFSGIITSVTLVDGGSGYVEGDYVPVISDSGSGAQIVVFRTTKGSVKAVVANYGGAGFRQGDDLLVTTAPGDAGTGARINVFACDITGTVHPNSYNIVTSTIQVVANNIIGNVSGNNYETWAFANLATIYTNTSNLVVNTGSGSSVTVINLSQWTANSNVYFQTYDQINVRNNIVTVVSSNITSNVIIVSPGLPGNLSSNTMQVIKKANVYTTIANAMAYWSYSNTGPALLFTVIDGGTNYVKLPSLDIKANTVIRSMGILGRMKIVNGGLNYTTNDTLQFINQMGDYGIGAAGKVTSVAANGMITGVKFEAQRGFMVGGTGYNRERLPTVKVLTSTGSGANVVVTTILGDGEVLLSTSDVIGKILQLGIVSGGTGYLTEPTLDLASITTGNTAQAYANIVTGAFTYPGRYLNDDGMPSGYNFLEDRDYYQPFSYVIKTQVPTNKYRKAIMDQLHPAGMKMFGEFLQDDEERSNDVSAYVIDTEVELYIST